ncbi:hypothetical protein ASA1KI_36330 [Opitutales bacterium ASA1]|uniref:hypothetical protein n=1 Tax=Congregicoccus parvus TaxID=3081749 RepID=UPI002B2D06C7|nr:hypothetical protein ASA1KI_36330 [Opitutales bacterium ASA1]
MNTPDRPSSSESPQDPEMLLGARLRETTPEFEARFDELRRRLAQEPRHRVASSWIHAWRAWLPAVAGVAVVAVSVLVLSRMSGRGGELAASPDVAELAEWVDLEDLLSDVAPLAGSESLIAILEMPRSDGGAS